MAEDELVLVVWSSVVASDREKATADRTNTTTRSTICRFPIKPSAAASPQQRHMRLDGLKRNLQIDGLAALFPF